jgi:UDP-GlcNAc:undecaprenyl-phosphate GlcNAc-1-phosphate transferase
MIEFFLTATSIILIYLLNKYRVKISNKTKLIDNPDRIRKFHKKPIPLLGGIMIFIPFFIINFYSIFFGDSIKTSLIIFLCSTGCFILGLIDDIYKISYKYKFLTLIIIFYVCIGLDSNFHITKIYFETFNRTFYFDHLYIPFTVLCLLLLTNAINLIDGIDGLCILISIIFFVWLIIFFKDFKNLYLILIISLFFILHLNIKKNIFLGDNGSLLIGSIIGLNIILNYNLHLKQMNVSVENIFILLMLPGLDMFRVFYIRISKKKNPFIGDRFHLHYLLIDQGFETIKTLIIFFLLIISPILLNFFTNIKPILIIFLYVIFYVILIFRLQKIKFFKKKYF